MTAKFWTTERLNHLKEIYNLPKDSIMAIYPGISWKVLSRQINLLGLYRRGKSWSVNEDNFLKEHYFLMPTTTIIHHLGRTQASINQRAVVLGLTKSNQIYRKGSAAKLIDGSLLSAYWIGFLLADGWISEYDRLQLALSIQDLTHLTKFAEYIGTSISTGMSHNRHYVRTTIKDIDHIPILKERFGFHNKKTYNPPVVPFNVSNEELMALVLGFIDGDGSINPRGHIRIKCHSSWLPVLTYFHESVQSYFNMDICNGPYINRQGYAQWSITKFELVDNLYKFGITNNLPLLERKWSLVKQHVPKFSHLNIDRIEELYRLRDLGHNISTIANILGCSTTTVKNYLKKLASA